MTFSLLTIFFSNEQQEETLTAVSSASRSFIITDRFASSARMTLVKRPLALPVSLHLWINTEPSWRLSSSWHQLRYSHRGRQRVRSKVRIPTKLCQQLYDRQVLQNRVLVQAIRVILREKRRGKQVLRDSPVTGKRLSSHLSHLPPPPPLSLSFSLYNTHSHAHTHSPSLSVSLLSVSSSF